MLTVGQHAPAFGIPDGSGARIELSEYHGDSNVLLYFYPKDDTPGCTVEANDFTRLLPEFARHDTVVFGVSRDSCASHQAFTQKFSLRVPLLADESGEVCEKYGVWQEKERDGVKKMGIARSTFIIDKQGMLQYVEYGVNPQGHAEQMLQRVRLLAE